MRRTLRFFGDPVLREPARPVEHFDGALRRLADDMVAIMHAEDGIGLAAQQIGETLSICVVDVPPRADVDEDGRRLHPDLAMPLALCNPRILRASPETVTCEEGCLSFPEIQARVDRPAEIDIAFQDTNGNPRRLPLRGLVARAVQHEMDHLAGVLLIDHMSAVKKAAVSGRLKRLRRNTREALAAAPA